ncbi:MAG: hypothetical protein WA655_12345 [Candidatus Korobacteraceae bacterium]
MRGSVKFLRTWLTVIALSALAAAADFTWDFRAQEVIGRDDPSVANTSKLAEQERTDLINAIVVRLDKPMAARGYDNDRIREIASTTRIRFVQLGADSKPVVLAMSVSMEGGCEGNNCPFWIFQSSPDGYVSLLDTIAASYTVQPDSTNGFSDLVTMRHTSATESTLTQYRYQDGKYVDSGCYTATWPAAKEGEIQEPAIAPCRGDEGKQPTADAPAKL